MISVNCGPHVVDQEAVDMRYDIFYNEVYNETDG